MGEENRGSSGGGTAMIVVAILGGFLLIGCCSGVVALGVGFFMAGTVVRDTAREVDRAKLEAIQAREEFDKIDQKVREEVEAIKVFDEPGGNPPPESAPVPGLPPESRADPDDDK
jgi:hypothetical protein